MSDVLKDPEVWKVVIGTCDSPEGRNTYLVSAKSGNLAVTAAMGHQGSVMWPWGGEASKMGIPKLDEGIKRIGCSNGAGTVQTKSSPIHTANDLPLFRQPIGEAPLLVKPEDGGDWKIVHPNHWHTWDGQVMPVAEEKHKSS
ncbi:MAG TPA: hypothetical protein VK674_03115 [Candidatus Limnocylindria bacterium]|nr:hypothetical protein [Candidatus Limnocylindria bacterium]